MSLLKPLTRFGFLLGVFSFSPESLQACATCFGASDAPMAQGMNMGILSLLIVIVSVLCGIAAFFIFLARRSMNLACEMAAQPQTQSNPAN